MTTVLPLSNAERKATFGGFRWHFDPLPTDPEHIRIDDGWDTRNLIRVAIPQLTDAHGARGRLVVLHAKAAQAFLDFFRDLEASGLMPDVHAFDGSWAPRFKRPASVNPATGHPYTAAERLAYNRTRGEASLSNHAWGTAIDLNAREWPLGRVVPASAPWRALGDVARRHGIMPGMDFRTRPDGMHFEIGKVTP